MVSSESSHDHVYLQPLGLYRLDLLQWLYHVLIYDVYNVFMMALFKFGA